jgi:hypothetical protein
MVKLLLLLLAALFLLLSSLRERFFSMTPTDPRWKEYRTGLEEAMRDAERVLKEEYIRMYGIWGKRPTESQLAEARKSALTTWNQRWQEMIDAEAALAAAAERTRIEAEAAAAAERTRIAAEAAAALRAASRERGIHGLPYNISELNQFYADFPQSGKDAFTPGLANLQGQTQAQMDEAKSRVEQNIKKFLGDMVDLMFTHYYAPLDGAAVTDAGIDAAVTDLQQKQMIILDMPPDVLAGLRVVFKNYFKR